MICTSLYNSQKNRKWVVTRFCLCKIAIGPCLTKEKIEIQIEPWEMCGFEQQQNDTSHKLKKR